MKNNLKKDYFWNTLGSGLVSVNSLIYLIIVTRINGIEIAGIFTLMYATSLILYSIGIYSGRTYQVTETSKTINDSDYIVHRLICNIIMIFAMSIFIIINNYNDLKLYILILLTVSKSIESICDVFHGVLQKNNKLIMVGKSLFIRSFCSVILFFLIDLFTRDILLSCFSIIIVNILTLIFIDIKNCSDYLNKIKLEKKHIGLIFKMGFAIFSISLINNYLFNIPRYALDINYSEFEGIYGIIIMPATIIILVSQFIIQPLIVLLKKYYIDKNKIKFLNCIKKVLYLIILVGILSIVICYFIGIPILNFLYGIELNDYKMLLLVVLLASTLYTVSSILSNALIIYRKNNIQLYVYIFVTMLSVILSYVLIPLLGFDGAIFSYFLTMLFLCLIYIILFVTITNKSAIWIK